MGKVVRISPVYKSSIRSFGKGTHVALLWLSNKAFRQGGFCPPSVTPPPRNRALLQAYQPLVSLNKALLNPYFWRGIRLGGGRLTSHEFGSETTPRSWGLTITIVASYFIGMILQVTGGICQMKPKDARTRQP